MIFWDKIIGYISDDEIFSHLYSISAHYFVYKLSCKYFNTLPNKRDGTPSVQFARIPGN